MRIHGEASIHIKRDARGISHVRASRETDIYRGLGYCHATDRGMQMLLMRVIGQGRASEYLDSSDAMLAVDTFFRRLNPAERATEEVTKLPAHHQSLLAAYCDGANRAFRRRVPWELRLLGLRPAPWTPEDCVLISRISGYVGLAQSQGEMEHLLVEMVQAGVPRGHLVELFGDPLDDLDLDLIKQVKLADRIVPDAVRWCTAVAPAVASNNWVVAGAKTASGNALLANDPHLEVNRLPSVWYEVVLEWAERFCIAATFPGLAAAAIGRTNDLAWGATYTFMDAVDSWIEDCRDGCYRRTSRDGDRWLPFSVRQEKIARKKKPAVTLTFYENDHGMLDGDPTAPGLYLATRWAPGSDSGAVTMSAFFDLLHARNVTDGMQQLGRVETAWNFVLADRHGNIGYQMSGRMPKRPDGSTGLIPLPGWDPENDWQGFVPADELPRAYNPEAGFIVTANNDLNHLGSAHPINLAMGAHRAARIAELLAARDDWDVQATAELHMDVFSPQAESFMNFLRPLLPKTRHGEVLRAWDLRYDLDSTGAPLFEKFYGELVAEVFGSACGPDVIRYLAGKTCILVDFYANFDSILLNESSAWYAAERRDDVFRRVAERALTGRIEKWGTCHRVPLRHLLFGGRLPRWLGFDRGPIPLRGGRATIHQGQVYESGGRATSFAPSYRLITDLGERGAHTTLAGGPSDRRFSRWYASGLEDWRAGRFRVLSPLGLSTATAAAAGASRWLSRLRGRA